MSDAPVIVPPGFPQITPYFLVRRAPEYMAFLVDGLGGVEVGRSLLPDGGIANGQVRIGTVTVMVGRTPPDWEPTRASLYYYVADADASVARALEHGAELVMPVGDMPYGDRQGGVRDPEGNLWWISQRLQEGPYDH